MPYTLFQVLEEYILLCVLCKPPSVVKKMIINMLRKLIVQQRNPGALKFKICAQIFCYRPLDLFRFGRDLITPLINEILNDTLLSIIANATLR